MPNEMIDSLFCECGGKYQHVDWQDNEDSYQCNKCKTWCIVTWGAVSDVEISRRYEEPEPQEEDSFISLDAINQALDNEIKWSRDNALLAPDETTAAWFIKGLEQAKWLIAEIAKVDTETKNTPNGASEAADG
jgi:hypothetical protein